MTTDVREPVAPVYPGVDDTDPSHSQRSDTSPRESSDPQSSIGQVDESRWARIAPLLLVAFAVGFSAWFLRSELRVSLYPNDAGEHASLVRFAAQRIRAGHNPFDAWYPYLGFGAPEFTQYQSLAHIVTGLLSIVLGTRVFRAESYLLICTLPISVFVGARLLGLDRWQSAAAALFSPMLSNVAGFGIEWKSFVWSGIGMWSMLWGVWFMPIALGLAWRAIAKGERIALAAFFVGLTCALHFIVGYFVLFGFVVFVLMRPHDFVYRLGRSAVVGVGGLLIFSFVFAPALQGLPFVNVSAFEVGTYWFNSYGPMKLGSWLIRGEVFDYGRLPVVSILVLAGAIVCTSRVRRSEPARVVLSLMALSLALYSGRSVVGPVVNYLPGGGALMLHRYILAVHFSGMLLAGIAAVWACRCIASTTSRMLSTRVRPRHAIVLAVTGGIALLVMYPVLSDRAHVAAKNRSFIAAQLTTDQHTGRDVEALVDIAKERGDGRIYAGKSSGWGYFTRVGQITLNLFPVQLDADSIGVTEVTNSLSQDVEPYFDEDNPAEYDLFNVKYVLLPSPHKPAIAAARVIATRGDFTLYEVPTSGYLEAVDATASVSADRSNIYAEARTYIRSAAVAEHRHPFVSFNGRATPPPSIAASAPNIGAPGSVEESQANLDNGHFGGTVHMTRPAWVMLKESYAPHWTATVDGKPVPTQMLAPSFIGIAVPAGTHQVAFSYKSSSSYPALFTIGALTLVGLNVIPWGWKRRRRTSRPRALPSA